MSGERFEIPVWMMMEEAVHARYPCIYTDKENSTVAAKDCNCTAAFLCERLVSAAHGSNYIGQRDKRIYHVIAALASQVCGKMRPFCQELHEESHVCINQ